MLVSVIIPVYNSSIYIQQCLDSCVSQGDVVREVIVVDDHSTDNSLQIINTYQDKYPSLIRVFINPQKGACSARNYGLAKSKGLYIQFLDSDDFLGKNKIKKQIEDLEKLMLDSISFSKTVHLYEYPNGDSEEVIDAYPFLHLSGRPAEFLCCLWGGENNKLFTIANSAWLVPKKVIDKAGLWNENLLRDQDGEFFTRVVLASKGIYFSDSAKTYYRKVVGGTSITKTNQKEYLKSELDSLSLKFSYLTSFQNDLIFKRAFANQYLRLAVSFYPLHRDLYIEAFKKYKSLNVQVPAPKLGGRLVETLKVLFGWKVAKQIKFTLKNLI